MPLFQYRAVEPGGAFVKGRIEALDRATAASRLQEQGHILLQVEALNPATGLRGLLVRDMSLKRRPGPKLVVDLVGRLSLLLDAGVALDSALSLLAASEGTPSARKEATVLLTKLRAGSNLADAMATQGTTFPPVVTAMVRAGESSGTLAPTLGRLAAHLSRAESVRQSIRSALVYPVVLLITALGSVLLILIVVLPQLEPIFAESGATLPFVTRLAFGASAIVRQGWWVLGLCFAAFFLAVGRLLKDPRMRIQRDALILRTPILGQAVRRAEAGRFVRVLGTLIGGGVGLAPALVLAQPVLANQILIQALAKVSAAVREGGGLAGPLKRAGVFPDLAVQLIRIGEATGRLDTMLMRLADLLEADVKQTLDRALALLVPILTIVLGALVAGILSSVMLAVLGVNDMVH